MFNLKNSAYSINNRDHRDILYEYSTEIQNTFEQVEGITPSLDEFFNSSKWRYCQTQNKKDRKKIGYRCEFGNTPNSKPYVFITVNNFKLGTSTFNSLTFDKQKREQGWQTSVRPIPPTIDYKALQQKEDREAIQKHALFQAKIKLWRKASEDTKSHPYVIKKKLLPNKQLRQMGELLIYPLTSLETGEIIGVQTIQANGEKRIYGAQAGACFILGDLKKSSTIYLCEGYATANAIQQLAPVYESFSVVNTLNCHNLITIALWIHKNYPYKKLVIAADNDQRTQLEGKGNAGLWNGSMAAIQTNATIIYPKQLTESIENIDWCDIYCHDSEKAIDLFRQKNTTSIKTLIFERLQYASKKISQSQLAKALYQVFKCFANNYPIEMNEEQLIDKVYQVVKEFNITPEKLRSLWVNVKKNRFAKALRAKTFPLNPDDKRYTVTEYGNIQEIEKAVSQLKAIHPKAIFITNAPMGTGKTQSLMKPHFNEEKEKGNFPMIITPTRSLTSSVASRFKSAHYQIDRDAFKKEGLPESLAITINSLIHAPFDRFLEKNRSVFIDEFSQVIRAIFLGTVKAGDRFDTHQKLSETIQKSNYTYIADADLNALALNEIGRMTDTKTPIFVMTLTKQETNTPYNFHHYPKTRLAISAFFQTITDAIERGEKLYIVSDSRTKIGLLMEKLKSLPIKIVTITAELAKSTEAKSFLLNPDAYLEEKKPDVVIVSPAVQSGLSIESDYFTRVMGICTETVTPTVFNQMLNRVRKPIPRDIVLCPKNVQKAIENADVLLAAAYQHHIQQFQTTKTTYNTETGLTHIGRLSLRSTDKGLHIQGEDLQSEHFERLSAQLKALDNQQRNQATAFLVLQTMTENKATKVIQHTLQDDLKEYLKTEQKNLNFIVKQTRETALCGVNTLSPKEYQERINVGANSIEEAHTLKRFEISDALNLNTITPDDLAFFDDNGVEAMENYTDLMNGLEHAQNLDETELTNGVSKSELKWHKSKVLLLITLFSILGVDPKTGAGCYDKINAKQLRNALKKNEELARYIQFKLNLALNSNLSDVAFVNKILKKLVGLKATRLLVREGQGRTWVYSVLKGITRLNRYVEQLNNEMNDALNDDCHQK